MDKKPYILSWVVSTWTFITLRWVFTLPIILSLWVTVWVLFWSYLVFKWLDSKEFEEKIVTLREEIKGINEELDLNKSYLEEYSEYFYNDSKDIKNIEKYMDILIFKNIFFSNSIETKLYKLKDDISNMFLLIDDNFSKLDLSQKHKALDGLTKINDLKKELNILLEDTKKDIIHLMNKTLENIKKAKTELEKIESKDYRLEQNIATLEIHYNLLKEKIKKFDT